ncbi:MAG: O-antigen ligase family protein [Coriobacteriia bacterium]
MAAKSKKPDPKKQAAAKAAARAAESPTAGMDRGEKAVWFCLHLLVILVPVAISNLTWLGIGGRMPLTYDQFDIAKVFTMRVITLVAAGLWGWRVFTRGGTLRRTKVDWLVLIFLAWVALTTVTSIHPPTAIFGKYRRFEGLISFVNYAVVFFLVVQMVDRPSRIRSLARSLVFGGLLVSLYGVAQYFGKDIIPWGSLPFEVNRSFASYGNPDLLGGYLMFPLPIALALALSEPREGWRIFYWCTFLLVMMSWLTAFVRGAWIGGAVSIVIVAFAAFRARSKPNAIDWGFMAFIGAAGIGIVTRSAGSSNSVTNVVSRLKSIGDVKGGSALTRFQIWQAAWDAVKARPIVGWGADTFRLIFPRFKPVEYTGTAGFLSVADNVHDYPLQIMSALGIPGFVLLYGLFGWALWISAPAAFAKGKGGDRLLLAGFWASAVGYLAHLMFGLSVTGSTIFLWIVLAVVLTPFATSRNVRAPSWGGLAAIVLVVVVVLGQIGNLVYVVADRYYLIGRIGSNGQARIDAIKRSIELNPYNDMYLAELGLAHQDLAINYLNAAQTEQSAGRDGSQYLAQGKQEFLLGEQALKRTIDFVPSEYDNYVFLSNLYNMAADYFDPIYRPMALDIAMKGEKVEPFGPAIRFQAAVAYERLGQRDKAIAELQTAFSQDTNYAEVRGMLVNLYTQTGQTEKAKQVYIDALKRDPANGTLLSGLASLEGSGSKPATATK